jgi:hypothetical protein
MAIRVGGQTARLTKTSIGACTIDIVRVTRAAGKRGHFSSGQRKLIDGGIAPVSDIYIAIAAHGDAAQIAEVSHASSNVPQAIGASSHGGEFSAYHVELTNRGAIG